MQTDTLKSNSAPRRFESFAEFYAFYLTEHSNRTSRRLHYLATLQGPFAIATSIITGNLGWVFASIGVAYGIAWVGHFVFEKNKPAAWRNPFYSFASDWVMTGQMLRGKIPF